MNRINYQMEEEENGIGRLVNMFSKKEFSSSAVIKKAAFLLIQYNADPQLIEMLLRDYPSLRRIYMNSPEIAKDIIETMREFDSHERYN